jgi:AcrR family transcriptional regulator
VLQRHANRAAVGVALWEQRLWEVLQAALSRLVAAVDEGRSERLTSAWGRFVEPSQRVRASVELLLVSTYVPALRQAVERSFGQWFRGVVDEVPREVAARRSLAVGLALGYVLEAGVRGAKDRPPSEELAGWSQAFVEACAPVEVPARRADLQLTPGFDTGDSTWDAVLLATVDSVVELGYEAATIEVIAARCGFTRTVIFRRYRTKHDLFLDASQRTLGPLVLAMDVQRLEVEAECGTGISDSWFGRELMRPELRGLRTLLLEQVRLATHVAGLREVLDDALGQPDRPMAHTLEGATQRRERGKRATEMALSAGMLLLAQLHPQSWSLPYDVVLVPWRKAQERV